MANYPSSPDDPDGGACDPDDGASPHKRRAIGVGAIAPCRGRSRLGPRRTPIPSTNFSVWMTAGRRHGPPRIPRLLEAVSVGLNAAAGQAIRRPSKGQKEESAVSMRPDPGRESTGSRRSPRLTPSRDDVQPEPGIRHGRFREPPPRLELGTYALRNGLERSRGSRHDGGSPFRPRCYHNPPSLQTAVRQCRKSPAFPVQTGKIR